MYRNLTTLLRIFILAGFLASILLASPVLAAVTVLSVSPNLIANNMATTLTVKGADFEVGSTVSLDGYGALSTAYVAPDALSAVVPSGIAVGAYTVTVTNPDASTASLSNGLTVAIPTPVDTPDPAPFGRPQLEVKSYQASVSVVEFGKEFNLVVKVRNSGQQAASNAQATFTSTDLAPRTTGGLVVLGGVAPDNSVTFSQPMVAGINLWGKSIVTTDMTLSYYDQDGTQYSEKFTLILPLSPPQYVAPTATPVPSRNRPQLIISGYATSVDLLQPGTQFILDMQLRNVGNASAKDVVMIVGGGSSAPRVNAEGTPQPGGVTGGGGEFTNFAPLGASNVQSLADIAEGAILQAVQPLVVNVSTSPGAYPFKITLSYIDEKGLVYNDDQVITLLVYNLPNVEMGFYQTPVTLTVGQPGVLPLQVTNMGRQSVVLGNLRVEAGDVSMENQQVLIGYLDPGYPFTLDTTIYPDTPGTLELTLTLAYTDDFNQPRTITQTLTVEVMDAVFEEPPLDGEGLLPSDEGISPPETFWQRVWRFILGLLGLDSSAPQVEPVPGMEAPAPETPIVVPGKG